MGTLTIGGMSIAALTAPLGENIPNTVAAPFGNALIKRWQMIDTNYLSWDELKNKYLDKYLAQFEPLRGSGYCIRCEKKFPDDQVEFQFRVIHPFTNESKLSLLCKTCRVETVTKLTNSREVIK
jgi:hypothetical protein